MTAAQLPAELQGQIKPYKGNGRKLGYPTANLDVDTELADGVYFGQADLASWHEHPALIFIGTPTTVGDKQRRVEAYLLDIPDEDYYGLELNLEVIHFHRSNQTFKTIEELTTVMHEDEAAARQWFSDKKN
jgi:riboflavin kinase/FMN adenylyltransferase